MIKEQYSIFSSKSTQLFSVCWHTEKTPDAILFIVHGLGEHHGRYEEMAEHFVDNGIAVFAFDHRGHGISEGKKGYSGSIDQFIEDVEHVLMKCRSIFLEIPIFLFGHSMGGLIVAAYLDKIKSKEISGAIISSPWLRLTTPPSKRLLKLINLLTGIIPSLTLSNGLDSRDISSVNEEVELYEKDSLIHDKISVSLFKSLFAKGVYLSENAESTKLPSLVCHGTGDKITNTDASRRYAELLGIKAEFKAWEKSMHEPHHDFEKISVINFYINWIKNQLK